MKNSDLGLDGRQKWAINGRFLTQRVTGVQRYALEIINALDGILSERDELERQLRLQLILPPGAEKQDWVFRILASSQLASALATSGINWFCRYMRNLGC